MKCSGEMYRGCKQEALEGNRLLGKARARKRAYQVLKEARSKCYDGRYSV